MLVTTKKLADRVLPVESTLFITHSKFIPYHTVYSTLCDDKILPIKLYPTAYNTATVTSDNTVHTVSQSTSQERDSTFPSYPFVLEFYFHAC